MENTDGTLFLMGPYYAPYLAKSNGGVCYLPSDCANQQIVPLDGGRVLLRSRCTDPSKDFRIFDRNLNLVGTFPGIPGVTSMPGMTRRPDGSIVTCSRTASGWRLTAYTLNGAVIWDRSIIWGGSVASDAGGNLYVLVGTDAIDVYNSQGVFDHSWGGPPGQPLSYVVDIASSADGSLLFAMSGYVNGAVRVFSQFPTPSRSTSWGKLKLLYRDVGKAATK